MEVNYEVQTSASLYNEEYIFLHEDVGRQILGQPLLVSNLHEQPILPHVHWERHKRFKLAIITGKSTVSS
jgi:hypothetical protein